SVCYMCQTADSGIRAHRVNGVLVKIEGDPDCHPNYGRQCLKGLSAIMTAYNPKRVLKPLKRTNPEKGLGIDPKWVEISYDEALNIIVKKVKEIRESNPLKLMMTAFDYPPWWLNTAWVIASGGQFFFGGSTICGWYHNSCYTHVASFFREVDYEHCDYLILWACQSGALVDAMPVHVAKHLADARARGMKVVIDTIRTNDAIKADEWIKIRPCTDGALALSMLNVLINELRIYDEHYLKEFTNGPYLVGPDGYFLRDKETGKPMVWDLSEGKAKPFTSINTSDMALEGEYEVDHVKCFPAFQMLKEHVKKYSPEKASEVTTIPVETIRRISKEFGEAAKIGSTIIIDGRKLPLRPAAILDGRGMNHAHAYHNVYATMLLNTIIGNLNVPGGVLGISTYHRRLWGPKVDEDGMQLSPNWFWKFGCLDPYPPRKVVRPRLYNLIELCPIASYSDNFVPVVMENPKRFGIDYDIEMLLINWTNPIMNLINPDEMARLVRKIPLVVGLAVEMNEAMEMCDILIPIQHWTERYDPLPNPHFKFMAVGRQDWHWFFRRPILKPAPGVKHSADVLIDIAEKAGFLKELNETVNWHSNLEDPYKLQPDRKYSYLEIGDRILKSRFGVGVDWFEKNNTQVFIEKKTIEEAYPILIQKGRVPIYFEYWKRAGEEVKKMVNELGIADIWDTEDYVTLPEWKPCPSYEPVKDYDLLVVNYKLPYHTHSFTLNNPWLKEVASRHRECYGVLINTETAKKKGIEDGDEVIVESEFGYQQKGKAVVTEGIHPECIGIAGTFGKRALGEDVARGVGVHWNALYSHKGFPRGWDKVSCAIDGCIRVKIYKSR
ncbi:molybdopterin-dependent oxidoreductase, partial [Candidatus Bathyarchaeota archaeon]|nr:molybdopterin-dependent oxidoreductase [Candidatus Bathyarchaeota archaeon]